MNVHKGWAFPRGIYSEVHSPITTPEIICVMALTLQPIRGCPQHSGETGTRLLSAIHRRLLSRFFLREGGRLYTGYCSNCLCVNVYYVSREALWARASTCIQGHKHRHRQDNVQEFCARKCHSLAFEFCTQTFLWPYIFECHSALFLHHSYWMEVGKYNIYVNWL